MGRACRPRRAIAAGLSLWLLGAGGAVACMPPPAESWHPRLLAESAVIFAGTVTEVLGPQGDLALIAVARRWRGEVAATVQLGERGNAACRARRFRPGERLVVFAERPLDPGPNRIGPFRILDEPIADARLRAGLDALRR